MKAVHVFVTGRVQGVWFRASTQSEAVSRGVDGFVRNLRDGRVEAWFQGEDDAVDAMVAWCREGPQHARVEHVTTEDVAPVDVTGFAVAATSGAP